MKGQPRVDVAPVAQLDEDRASVTAREDPKHGAVLIALDLCEAVEILPEKLPDTIGVEARLGATVR